MFQKKIIFILLIKLVVFSCKGDKQDKGPLKPDVSQVKQETLPAMKVLSIARRGSFTGIKDAFGEMFAYLGKIGMHPVAPPFGIYYSDPKTVKPADLKWEIAVPVSIKLTAPPGFMYKEMKAMNIISIIFEGDFTHPYYRQTWTVLGTYIKDKKCNVVGPPMEIYLSRKGVMGATVTRTKIVFPIAK